MDIVVKRSGGQNVVLRPQARAPWQPPATVDPHQVEVFYQELDGDGALVGAPIPLGRFAPVGTISIPYYPTTTRTVRVYVMPLGPDGTPASSSLRDAQQFDVLFDATNAEIESAGDVSAGGDVTAGGDVLAGGRVEATGNVEATGKALAQGGIGGGNSAAATTPGAVVRKMEVFDANGNSIGFVPIYDSIS